MSTAELLRRAATALDAGEDPFGNHFLDQNEVSLDECFTLAQMLAIGARVVARGIENPQSAEGQVFMMEMARVP